MLRKSGELFPLPVALLLPAADDLPPLLLEGPEDTLVQWLHKVCRIFWQEDEPYVELLTLGEHERGQMRSQIVSYEDLDVVSWQSPFKFVF